MTFDLQVNNKTFKINILFSNYDGFLFSVYEHIPKKHRWSCGRKYLFKDTGVVGEDVKEQIVNRINEHLENERVYNDFRKQVAELSR